jgi:hypothetical protein
MKLPQVLLLISIVYILAYVGHARHLGRTVYGDGVFYYSWLRSVVIDRDIDFSNDYAHEQVTQPLTSTGRMGNKYSIGEALFWAPAFITTHAIVRGDGWSLPYQGSVGITSVLAAITGLVLLTRIVKVPILTLLLIAGGTNLFFYGAIDPVNSHALSFFAAVVFLSFLATAKRNWFAIGLSLAVLASVRLHDSVYALALLPLWKRIQWRSFIGGFLLGLFPQLAAWYTLYGTLANPYVSGGETFDFLHPQILGVLFGAGSGLILWTPIVAVGVAGLVMNIRRYWPYLTVFVAQLYIVASWSTWWQGASVSGRMFVSSLPLIALGLGHVMGVYDARRLFRPYLPLIVLGVIMVNALATFYYLFTY